jgi:hypothetical protein
LEAEVTNLTRKHNEFSRAHSDQIADLQSKTGKQLEEERIAREKKVADAAAAHAKALSDRDSTHRSALSALEKERAAERALIEAKLKDWESKWNALT